nr:hypothetical protein [Acidimicrobiia bacterium]
DLAGGSFALVIQDIAGLHSTPDEVPTGGLLPSGGFPLWAMVAAGLALIGAAGFSLPKLAARRSSR